MHVCFGSVQELLAAESESLSLRAKKLFKYTYMMYMHVKVNFSIFVLTKLQHYSLAAAHRAPCSGPPAGARGVSSLCIIYYSYSSCMYSYTVPVQLYVV